MDQIWNTSTTDVQNYIKFNEVLILIFNICNAEVIQ